MNEQIVGELLKQTPLVAVLGGVGWLLWNRYDKFTERTQKELDETRAKIEKYITVDMITMRELMATTHDLMAETRDAIKQHTAAVKRNDEVLGCMIGEIKEFKKGELYQEHQDRVKKMHIHKP